MSNSVLSHRRQPTRLCCPWDSPGKNTGVGCHFLLQCMKVKRECEVAQSCPTLHDPMVVIFQGRVWDFPGKSTGVGCHCFLPGLVLGPENLHSEHSQIIYWYTWRMADIEYLREAQMASQWCEHFEGLSLFFFLIGSRCYFQNILLFIVHVDYSCNALDKDNGLIFSY